MPLEEDVGHDVQWARLLERIYIRGDGYFDDVAIAKRPGDKTASRISYEDYRGRIAIVLREKLKETVRILAAVLARGRNLATRVRRRPAVHLRGLPIHDGDRKAARIGVQGHIHSRTSHGRASDREAGVGRVVTTQIQDSTAVRSGDYESNHGRALARIVGLDHIAGAIDGRRRSVHYCNRGRA